MRESVQATRRRIAGLIEAFESACAASRAVAITDFLPADDDEIYGRVLAELIRVDLERAWQAKRPKRLEDYEPRHPALFADVALLTDVAYEEYRLRRLSGEAVSCQDYALRYGVNTEGWEAQPPRSSANSACRESGGGSASPASSFSGSASTPREAQSFDRFSLPSVGDEFAGFELLAELGRGAFAAVFLARQADLSNRFVVLKVSSQFLDESQTLAQLQHTNIVPIYSIHRRGPLHALCMPFLGATTLADVLHEIRAGESLPRSGHGLRSTIKLKDRSTRKSWSSLSRGSVTDDPVSVAQSPVAPHAEASSWENLAQLSYVEAIVWLFSRITDGLAHAHQHGIMHQDLKPANILLRDDGEPMLLDFNLAVRPVQCGSAVLPAIGGTLPYMSPEQLQAIAGEKSFVDCRSDVFAMGVIMFELLTGRSPFPPPVGEDISTLRRLIADRRDGPPLPRCWNRQVSPAVQAIVLRCLDPNAGQRYQSARELQEDLAAQLAHQPLKHLAEPSRAERLKKWARRHPRLSSGSTIAMFAAVLVTALSLMLTRAYRQIMRHEADRTLAAFTSDQLDAHFDLDAPHATVNDLDRGLNRGRRAISAYGVGDDAAWQDGALVRYLPGADQSRLISDLGDLALALSSGYERRARFATGDTRAELLRNAAELATVGGSLNPLTQSPRESLLKSRRLYGEGKFAEAGKLLAAAVADQPQNIRLWLLKGRCHEALLQWDAAEVCYTVCLALRPEFAGAHLQRGLCRYWKHDYETAVADFTRALELRPGDVAALVNRALARQQLRELPAAKTDLDRAIELEPKRTRLYFCRARLLRRMGEPEAAKRDEAEAMRQEPADADGWIARGVFHLPHDPAAALSDFESALRLDPRSFIALQNKAHVMSERLGRADAAIGVLDDAIALYSDFAPAITGRGVLLARKGDRQAALLDARRALACDSGATTYYQAACIYSLTSRQELRDVEEAVRLLTVALNLGGGRELIGGDPDLDPLRNHPDFRRLLSVYKLAQPH
jgi:serine/threonine protein kinase/lipoprotein NlpI